VKYLNKKDWTGTWHLYGYRYQDVDGSWHDTKGEVQGLLIYDPAGFMSVTINWSNPEKHFFYAGPYYFEGKSVFHEVWFSNEKWRKGQTLSREFQFEGEELILTGDTNEGCREVRWGRTPKKERGLNN